MPRPTYTGVYLKKLSFVGSPKAGGGFASKNRCVSVSTTRETGWLRGSNSREANLILCEQGRISTIYKAKVFHSLAIKWSCYGSSLPSGCQWHLRDWISISPSYHHQILQQNHLLITNLFFSSLQKVKHPTTAINFVKVWYYTYPFDRTLRDWWMFSTIGA